MASGKTGPVPYKAIHPTWEEYINPTYLPTGISFKDPSKYLADESNAILKLWRARQMKGEVVFKFDFVLGNDKLPDITDYPAGVFDSLRPAGLILHVTQAARTLTVEDEPLDDGEDLDDDEELPIRKRKAAYSDDEESAEESEHPTDPALLEVETAAASEPQGHEDCEQAVEYQLPRVAKGSSNRKIIVSDTESGDSDSTPPAHQQPKPLNIGSSPTLAASSPTHKVVASQSNAKGRLMQGRGLLTPEPSASSTPAAPESSRQLRPRKTTAARGEAKTVAASKANRGRMG